MKKNFLLIILLTTAAMSYAQTTLSRSEAIQLGLKNRFDVQSIHYDVAIAASKVKQTTNKWLPTLSGDGYIKYSPQLQNTVIPGGVLPGYDETTLLPLMVKNETVFGLNLIQPLFNPTLKTETKLAKTELALQEEKNHAAQIDIMLQISRAYLDVQLKGLQKRIAADIAERNHEYEMIATGMYNNGTLIENYYLRAILDRENADQLSKQADQNYELSVMNLRYQLNVPDETTLLLSDSLDAVTLTNDKTNGERTEIKQLALQQEENKINLLKYKQDLLPTLSMGANYSQLFLSDKFNYGTGRWWSPFSYVTLNMHIPISAHVKNKAVLTEYRQKISQHELLLQQRKADINYEVQQARTLLANALLNQKNAKNSYELSKTIFHNQQEQYRLGAFDYSALLDTEKSLSTTERNYIQSAYELMLAQIQLQKATNNF
ncbi:TolC family protein [Chitinophaga sancti]|uniref:TolC family protein n=1 Tax=Chitinophaga sancti TaxID=1004 RepID=UPI002A75AC2F|nr:TolC family protein [Chitinophaga sancti]WPQ62012.1 TolC family protein [Chitinophaga sancti]